MKCPKCRGSTTIVDTNHIESRNQIWRRRRCDICEHVFHTAELRATESPKFTEEWNHWKQVYRCKLAKRKEQSC